MVPLSSLEGIRALPCQRTRITLELDSCSVGPAMQPHTGISTEDINFFISRCFIFFFNFLFNSA